MHKTEIRVQWFDTDRENVVYFGNYFRFFSIAEDEFMRTIGLNHNTLKKVFGIAFTRVEAECRYKRPATYDDLIEVETRAKLENHTVLTFLFRVFRKEGRTLLAEGKIRTACVRLGDAFKLVKMPKEVRESLEQAITNQGEEIVKEEK